MTSSKKLVLVYAGTVAYIGKVEGDPVHTDLIILKEALRFIEMSVPTGQGTYGKIQSLTPVIGNYDKFPDVLVKYDAIIELAPEMELYKYYEETKAGMCGLILPKKNNLIIK